MKALQIALLLLPMLLQVVAADSNQQQTTAASESEEPTFKLDPEMIRDAIASVLRSNSVSSNQGGADDDGYSEAAQEYLEHVQSVLTSSGAPSELYIREQLADLSTLTQLLDQLQLRQLSKKSTLRLASRLLKGPARELVLPTITADSSESDSSPKFSFVDSEMRRRMSEAAKLIGDFLTAGKTLPDGDVGQRLKAFAGKLESGVVRDYLDGVLDRMLELEGRKIRFNVEYPDADANKTGDADANEDDDKDAASHPALGKPKVSRLPDEEDVAAGTKSQTSATSTSDGDDGKTLFDQVLCRRAAESVAAALAKDTIDDKDNGTGSSSSAAGRQRIQELRQRKYQAAGLEAMLEAIEECL